MVNKQNERTELEHALNYLCFSRLALLVGIVAIPLKGEVRAFVNQKAKRIFAIAFFDVLLPIY